MESFLHSSQQYHLILLTSQHMKLKLFFLAFSTAVLFEASAQSIDIQYVDAATTANPRVSLSDRGGEDPIHIVKEGENLYRIAKAYGVKLDDLKRVNGLTNDYIRIGQSLKIPVAGGQLSGDTRGGLTVSAPDKRVGQQTAPLSNQLVRWVFHTVQPGDNLQTIADSYQLSASELSQNNDGIRDNQLSVGDKLKIRRELVPADAMISPASEMPALAANQSRGSDDGVSFKVEEPQAAPAVDKGITKQLPTRPDKRVAEPAMVETPANVTRTETVVTPTFEGGARAEEGTYIAVKNEKTTEKYYVYHKSLPKGTVVRVYIPNNPGYIEARVMDRLRADRVEILGLSPDIVRIIGGIKQAPVVKVAY